MKRASAIAVAATLIPLAAILATTTAAAHSGGTDASGCHTNRSTGDYHCHEPKRSSGSGRSSSPSSPSVPLDDPANIINIPSLKRSPSPTPSSSTGAPSGSLSVIVTRIADGDTVDVLQNGRAVKVRLVCIDSPELNQERWGNASAKHLASLLPVGSAAQLRVVERDRFGRTVAEIYRDGRSVNLQMVRDGQAVVFRRYLDNCTATREQYLQSESEAKQARRGYWNQSSPVMPWDWRRGKRCNSTGPECWVH